MKNIFKKDRNARYKPWVALQAVKVSDELKSTGVVACFYNHLVIVFIRELECNSIFLGENESGVMVHLSIRWADLSRKDEIPYKIKQRIKNEIMGGHCEAVELFPAIWREDVETPYCNLWVLPDAHMYPVGVFPQDVIDKMSKLRESDKEKADEDMYTVFYSEIQDGVLEVYENAEEYESSIVKHSISIKGVEQVMKMSEVIGKEGQCTVAYSESAKRKKDKFLQEFGDILNKKTDANIEAIKAEDEHEEDARVIALRQSVAEVEDSRLIKVVDKPILVN